MSQVLREQLEGGVTLLRINRSERLNALSVSVREELAARAFKERCQPQFEGR